MVRLCTAPSQGQAIGIASGPICLSGPRGRHYLHYQHPARVRYTSKRKGVGKNKKKGEKDESLYHGDRMILKRKGGCRGVQGLCTSRFTAVSL